MAGAACESRADDLDFKSGGLWCNMGVGLLLKFERLLTWGLRSLSAGLRTTVDGQLRVLAGGSFRAAQSGMNPHSLSKGFEEYLPPQNARCLWAAAATKWLN
jgi:hypothetical protein